MSIACNEWLVNKVVFTPGPKGSFDAVAVKDPSIVYFDGEYHLFYTGIGEYQEAEQWQKAVTIGYAHAPTLERLNQAPRANLNAGHRLSLRMVAAPQVFYFRPHKLWYLITQVPTARPVSLLPVFCVNSDIRNPNGWSKPEVFTHQRVLDCFWIDFWIICDDTHAHFFYTDHDGRLFRQEAPLDKFPFGFGPETLVAEERGEDAIGPWRLHEASHVYRIQSTGKYFALVEGVRPHPTRPKYWDSRSRFMFALEADSLRGPWRRVEQHANDFLGAPEKLRLPDGSRPNYHQISHPELIRAGYDERLEVPDTNFQLLFQAFDASETGADYDYHQLPWELALAGNK